MDESQKTDASPQGREKQPFSNDQGTPDVLVGRDRKILVVDDNPVVVRALELKLKASGFSVITAVDASDGLRAARKDKPALIVLDINFRPSNIFSSLNWDGINIMQWLRKVQDVSHIPVVILTMEDPARYQEATVAGGAAAFFQKPVDFKVFIAAVQRLLGDNS